MYTPPSFGMAEPSSAKLKAVKEATTPATMMEKITEGPAKPIAMPKTTKIPAPMIAPTPIATASKRLRVLLSSKILSNPMQGLFELLTMTKNGQIFIVGGSIRSQRRSFSLHQ